MLMRLVLVITFAVWSTASVTIAQSPIDPKLAEQTMQTHPGWSAAVIANEPVVIDPVAIRFDRHRRLWVVEMSDYPTGPKPGQPASGRIRILEDRDQDGRYETATTFADQLLFPTGVQPWRDGAIVTLAGKIMWMRDRDQDGVADTFEVWFEGFATENEQLRANHPVLGPDGMVYVAGGLRGGKVRAVDPRFTPSDLEVDLRDHDFCFDPDGGTWRAITGNSQFGTTIDDYGRRVGCSNRNPAFTTILDDAAIARDVLLSPRDAVDDIALAGEASRVNPRTDAWTTSNLHAGQFSAACGVAAPGWFDDGSQSGEWLLVCEPTGSLIQRQWIREVDGVWRSTRDPRPEEFLSSTDSWFRPVDIVAGPEQAVYVADMVRAVIEHPQWAPVELKDRPDTWDGNDRGRLWKLAPASINTPDPAGTPDVTWLGHPNPWVREMASQYFLEVAEPKEVAEDLRSVIANPHSPPTAVSRAAQWFAARQLHGLDSESLQRLLSHEHPGVVCVGVLLASPDDLDSDLLTRLAGHPSARVRLVIAAKLAAQPSPEPKAIELIRRIAERDGSRPVPLKVLGSVDDSQLPELCRVSARQPGIPVELVRHWWTRWTVVAREDALTAIFPDGSALNTQADAVPADADDRTVALLDAWIRGNQMAGEKRLSRAAIQNTIGDDRRA
ncbi:MAG: PVC-type heme-binding CxxCH protein, partial [Planctomycetaceae bacterium]